MGIFYKEKKLLIANISFISNSNYICNIIRINQNLNDKELIMFVLNLYAAMMYTVPKSFNGAIFFNKKIADFNKNNINFSNEEFYDFINKIRTSMLNFDPLYYNYPKSNYKFKFNSLIGRFTKEETYIIKTRIPFLNETSSRALNTTIVLYNEIIKLIESSKIKLMNDCIIYMSKHYGDNLDKSRIQIANYLPELAYSKCI